MKIVQKILMKSALNKGGNGEYCFLKTPFAESLVAFVEGDLAEIIFFEARRNSQEDKKALKEIKQRWPKFNFQENSKLVKVVKTDIFGNFLENLKNIKKGPRNVRNGIALKSDKNLKIVLKGTDFQLQVWKELLKIPHGKTATYEQIAKAIGRPKAVRAVGSAIGKNSVAFLIPCHRVINKSGKLGGYRWGLEVKKKILDWERG